MKRISYYILERLHINKDTGNHNHYNYHPKTGDELKELIDKLIKERGNDANLNDIDTSKITDMNYMFADSKFNGDISNWDVSNVENMNYMFQYCENFNCDLSKWDVSNVKRMILMFQDCKKFEGKGLENWNVSNVINMRDMFDGCTSLKNKPSWYK